MHKFTMVKHEQIILKYISAMGSNTQNIFFIFTLKSSKFTGVHVQCRYNNGTLMAAEIDDNSVFANVLIKGKVHYTTK